MHVWGRHLDSCPKTVSFNLPPFGRGSGRLEVGGQPRAAVVRPAEPMELYELRSYYDNLAAAEDKYEAAFFTEHD
jgi:hypothetical protein